MVHPVALYREDKGPQIADPILHRWIAKFRKWLLRRLEREQPCYQQRILNDMDRLRETIRPGDVVLVEGRSDMSRIIKLFSSSHWSHVALYVGDRLIRPEHPDHAAYRKRFRAQGQHLVVEAFSGDGVIVAPLAKYRDFNIRICRPYGISAEDRRRVIHEVTGNIGRRYDDRNILEIAKMAAYSALNPGSRRSYSACIGGCNEFEVICSGMIAKAFQKVGYPIIPALKPLPRGALERTSNPYGAVLFMRHFSQILPRDFDLSPNFEVIKFNIIGHAFNYRELWQEKLP
jgi:hypothetical protein